MTVWQMRLRGRLSSITGALEPNVQDFANVHSADVGEDVLKLFRILMMVVMTVLAARAGLCGDPNVTFDISLANLSPSSSSGADWGWWNPGKYDEWDVDDSADFMLADVRLLVAGKTYTAILDGEWFPTLNAVGTSDLEEQDEDLVQQLSMKTSAYDLGIGQWFGKDYRNGIMPWVGATYVRITEDRTTIPLEGSTNGAGTDSASAGLWGVVIGADGSYGVWSNLDITGRLLVRWASGTRTATISPQDPGTGTVEVSDSIDSWMWGIDLGLRWNATKAFWVEAGWRYRDQTYDSGPASYGGPQIKAAYVFWR
jgi:hypothetical protein